MKHPDFTSRSLGRMERVAPRDIWPGESSHFTPWLAREDNLALLSDALGLELEREETERSVGPFKADILCRTVEGDGYVLIENQLARTDHVHLGQLITYAAGLKAATIVWIADPFTDEHRAALDWLNSITEPEFRFFGIEIEIWQIGQSDPAPKFNLVSTPNAWTKAVEESKRPGSDADASPLMLSYRKFWSGLNEVLDQQTGPIKGGRKPPLQSWMSFPVGRAGVSLNAAIARPRNHVRAEIYMSGETAAGFFHGLQSYRDVLAQSLPDLVWEPLPQGLDKRISLMRPLTSFEDESTWPGHQRWLSTQINRMHEVFAPILREIDPSDHFQHPSD